MTKSKKEENSENKDETSVTNEELAAEISNTEEQEEKKDEAFTEETDTTSNDKSEDKSEESQEDELEKTEVKETEIKDSPEASPNVSDDSDTDSPDNPKINGISEKLISLETESEKESEKEDSDDDVKHINKTNIIPKINNFKINTVETVSAENSFSISLNNNDLEKSNLSIFEKKIIQKIFVKSIESVREVIDNPNIESVIAITIIITNIAQLLEHVKINSVSHSGKISGNMKKNIVLFLGRLIIEKNMSFTEKDNILALYDIYADSVLERIIKFAKNNKVSNMVEQKYDESVSHIKNKTKNCCIIS